MKLQFGDKIFFRAGNDFTGQLNIEGQGEVEKPIVISKYGSYNDNVTRVCKAGAACITVCSEVKKCHYRK
jgi:hypothetical protein